MPYANYDDVRSICAVYNHCLKDDADMDFLEFIGEKMLAFGFETEEKGSADPAHAKAPINPNAIVQIQSGVLYQHAVEDIRLDQPPTAREKILAVNTFAVSQDFHPGIFHPPSVSI
jgi:hypothetical protein